MPDKRKEWKEELERQADQMREHLEEDDQDTKQQQVPRPPKGDPQHTEDDIAPGKTDVPAGGTTGGYMGRSANRKKGQSG